MTWVVVAVVLVLLVILGILSYQKNNDVPVPAQESESSVVGTIYVGVTDATADIKDVNDIDLSVKKVEIYSDMSGWMTLSSSEKKYPLLKLKAEGKTELYAKNYLKAGFYDRVRVTLGDVVVRTKTKGDLKATVPSSQIVIYSDIKIMNGQDTHFKLDFLADKSLHITVDGKYLFAPVVKAESRSGASVSLGAEDKLEVSLGSVDSVVSVGVDLSGSSRSNFELQTDSTLKIDAGLGTQLKFMLGGESYTKDDAQAEEDMDEDESTESDDEKNGAGVDVDGGLKFKY